MDNKAEKPAWETPNVTKSKPIEKLIGGGFGGGEDAGFCPDAPGSQS